MNPREHESEPNLFKEEWDEVGELRGQALKALRPSENNKEGLREIERTIASAVIISLDRKILMGKKDPTKGGVYPDDWHIPGGGVEPGQTLEEALRDEVLKETGIDVKVHMVNELPYVDEGETEKTLKDTGEKVWCKMEFHRFEVYIDKSARDIAIQPGDDLVELRWFSSGELPDIKQAASGKEFFIKAGYIEEK